MQLASLRPPCSARKLREEPWQARRNDLRSAGLGALGILGVYIPKGPKVVPFGGSFRILEGNPKKELLWGLWVGLGASIRDFRSLGFGALGIWVRG